MFFKLKLFIRKSKRKIKNDSNNTHRYCVRSATQYEFDVLHFELKINNWIKCVQRFNVIMCERHVRKGSKENCNGKMLHVMSKTNDVCICVSVRVHASLQRRIETHAVDSTANEKDRRNRIRMLCALGRTEHSLCVYVYVVWMNVERGHASNARITRRGKPRDQRTVCIRSERWRKQSKCTQGAGWNEVAAVQLKWQWQRQRQQRR